MLSRPEFPPMLQFVESSCEVLLCLLRSYCNEDRHIRPCMRTSEMTDIEEHLRTMLNFDWPSTSRDEFVRLFMELQMQFQPGPVVTRIICEEINERKRLRTELDELRRAPHLINEAVISMAFENDRRVRQMR